MRYSTGGERLVSETRKIAFFTLIASEEDARCLGILTKSLREFGGALRSSPILCYHPIGVEPPSTRPGDPDLEYRECRINDKIVGFPFAYKVTASALAEADCSRVGTLIWLNCRTLVLHPPSLLALDADYDAAVRIVHIRNIGSKSDGELDGFWCYLYGLAGLADDLEPVDTMIGSEKIRPYFNSHLLSVIPEIGVLRHWLERFLEAVSDGAFVSGPCSDELHRIFLHQAIFSLLLEKEIGRNRIRLLPPSYSYPLHFHGNMPEPDRAADSDDLVCPVYEEVSDLSILRSLALSSPHQQFMAGLREIDSP